jgi:diguanylate cyclase (GGDEF)-like protein
MSLHSLGVSHTIEPVLCAEPLAEDLLDAMVRVAGGEAEATIARLLAAATAAEQKLHMAQARVAELESLVSTDPLTGLANRRGLEIFLTRHIALAARRHETSALVFIDLDGLKAINDTFGHDAGDRAICHAATVLAGVVRATDFAARLAGDEFVAVLDNAGEEAADACMQRYLSALLAAPVEIRPDVHLSLRASYGVATYASGVSVGSLLARADARMYAMKRRNRRKALCRASA